MPTRERYVQLLKIESERAVLAARLEAARQELLYWLCRCGSDGQHEPHCNFPAAWGRVMSADVPPLAPE